MAKNFTDGTGRSFEPNDADDLGKIDQIQGGEEFEERLWFTADGVYALERLAYENGEEFRGSRSQPGAPADSGRLFHLGLERGIGSTPDRRPP